MFEPTPEFASDLDWMLQSGQASDEMLVEALVQEYYGPVFRLALACLDDPALAEQAAHETFVSALLHLYRYRSSVGVEAWLFRLERDVCRRLAQRSRRTPRDSSPNRMNDEPPEPQPHRPASEAEAVLWRAVDTLPERLRLPLVLEGVLGLSETQIAVVLRDQPSQVRKRLQQAREQVVQFLRAQPGQPAGPDGQDLETRLAQSLQGRWGEPQAPDVEAVARGVLRRAGGQRSFRRRLASLREAVMIGAAVLLVLALIWSANQLLPEPEVTPGPTRQPTRIIAREGEGAEAQPLAGLLITPIPWRLTQGPYETPEGVFYTVQPGDTLFSIGREYRVSPMELRDYNRLPEASVLEPGQLLVLPGRLTPSPLTTPSPLPTVVLPEPLPENADWDEIQLRFRSFTRHAYTYWIDALVVNYGPEGYVGPARVDRLQMWGDEVKSLYLTGPVNGQPAEVLLSDETGSYTARPGRGQHWFARSRWGEFGSQDSHVFSAMRALFGWTVGWNQIEPPGEHQVRGKRPIEGQDLLEVAVLDGQGNRSGLVWADPVSGLPHRSQEFGGQAGERLVREGIVLKALAGIPLPTELFDRQLPWRGGFARDYTGAPLNASGWGVAGSDRRWTAEINRLPYQAVPEDYDPARARLTFQYPLSFKQSETSAKVDVFAEDYFLGTVEFANPWTLACARSPDGARIAYVSQPFPLPRQDAHLHWFDLNDLEVPVHSPLGGVYVTQFAFAPDSRRLAVFGYDGQFASGVVYILDLEQGETEILAHLPEARSLVWSPDGTALALVTPQDGRSERIQVYDVATGEETFRIPLAEAGSTPPPNAWPSVNWGADFPVAMGGLEACSAAP